MITPLSSANWSRFIRGFVFFKSLMAQNKFKSEVLKVFKALHRTRQTVFNGDRRALTAARLQINDEFKKNMDLQESEINDKILHARDVEKMLRTAIVQAVETKQPGVYEVKITSDTILEDNKPFDPNADLPKGGKGCNPCTCQEEKKMAS